MTHHHKPSSACRLPLFMAICLNLMILAVPGAADAAGVYTGLGLGNSSAIVNSAGAGFHTKDWKPDVIAWRLFAGYRIIDYAAIEAGYISLGKSRVATMGNQQSFEATLSGLELTPVGLLPIATGIAVFARGGIVFWNSEIREDSGEAVSTEKKSGSDLVLSFGAQYVFLKHFAARAEYSLYDIDKAKAGAGEQKFISIDGMYLF
jgi:hypothetical protein